MEQLLDIFQFHQNCYSIQKLSLCQYLQKDYNQEAYYDDINYEAILNADYGYRKEETIAQSAKDIAKEHQ